MKKVLIIDDEEEWQNIWKGNLGGKAIIITAFSLEEAEKEFAANPDLDAIVLDACVPGVSPNTMPLAKKLRESFSGPIIAVSISKHFRERLVKAGCDRESEKGDLPKNLLEIIG